MGGKGEPTVLNRCIECGDSFAPSYSRPMCGICMDKMPKVKVVLNPVGPVQEVKEFDVPPEFCIGGTNEKICENQFAYWNNVAMDSKPYDPGCLSTKYNTRSMSPGDEVVIDGRRYKCEPIGWKEVK